MTSRSGEARALLLCCCLCLARCNTVTKQKDPSSCPLYKQVGANDLSLNDVVVEDKESNIICIRARFSLAIKVQEPIESIEAKGGDGVEKAQADSRPNDSDIPIVDLGYLQLDQIKSIENTCPNLSDDQSQYPDELKMTVTFECGKLAFNFKKDNSYYLSSIKGKVILGNNALEAEFLSEKPMFFTSDLNHHFRFNDLIEVNSSVKTEKLQLTANFYNTEIEVFRRTNSRSFVWQADEKSQPFATDATAVVA